MSAEDFGELVLAQSLKEERVHATQPQESAREPDQRRLSAEQQRQEHQQQQARLLVMGDGPDQDVVDGTIFKTWLACHRSEFACTCALHHANCTAHLIHKHEQFFGTYRLDESRK